MTKNSHVVYILDVEINYIRKDRPYRTKRSHFDVYTVHGYELHVYSFYMYSKLLFVVDLKEK